MSGDSEIPTSNIKDVTRYLIEIHRYDGMEIIRMFYLWVLVGHSLGSYWI